VDKTFLLTLVPAFKTPERWPEVLGEDGNSGHFEESQKYRVSATECAKFYLKDLFTTDLWVQFPVPKHVYSVKYSKQQKCKFPNCNGYIIQSIIRIFGVFDSQNRSE
jgi:hypothetical protein